MGGECIETMASSYDFKCAKEYYYMPEYEYLDICNEPVADSELSSSDYSCIAKGMDVRGIEVCYIPGIAFFVNLRMIVGFPVDESGFRQ